MIANNQEPISCYAKRSVVVETSPVTTFEVTQSQLLFQFLMLSPAR